MGKSRNKPGKSKWGNRPGEHRSGKRKSPGGPKPPKWPKPTTTPSKPGEETSTCPVQTTSRRPCRSTTTGAPTTTTCLPTTVPPPECPNPCRNPHQYCGWVGLGYCDNSCDSYVGKILNPDYVCPLALRRDCACEDGYLSDGKGYCISKEECK